MAPQSSVVEGGNAEATVIGRNVLARFAGLTEKTRSEARPR